MKTYVLTVSRYFPKVHKRAGEETFFIDKIRASTICRKKCYGDCEMCSYFRFLNKQKIHTIRSNYEFWQKRISEIQNGKAILSIRYWSGKPYKSRQIEICKLDKDSGIGIQELSPISTLGKIVDWKEVLIYSSDNTYSEIDITTVANNDGLSFDDFKEWFKNYDLSKPMAIIHFTNFRY